MIQWCPECRMLAEATIALVYEGGYLVEDRSICDSCGKILWDWKRVLIPKETLKIVEPVKKPKQTRLW